MNRKCVQCGKKFNLTESEIEFYKSKNLELPKRCAACRKQNKKKKQGKSSKRSPLVVVFAIIIAMMAYFFNGTGHLTKLNSNIPSIKQTNQQVYNFRSEKNLADHFAKHQDEFDYETAEEYLEGANRVIHSQNALHKLEAEDGDDVYYIEETNELVIVSTDGYIRTYFKPTDGIAYFNRT